MCLQFIWHWSISHCSWLYSFFFLTDRKRNPSATRNPNQKYDQREEKAERSQYAPGEGGMPRSPSDYGAGDRQRREGYGHSYEDAEVARNAYRARRGGWHSQEEYPPEPGFLPDGPPLSEHELQRQRQEEYQNRYRSDPNLARYPVKPQPYEEQMRMHCGGFTIQARTATQRRLPGVHRDGGALGAPAGSPLLTGSRTHPLEVQPQSTWRGLPSQAAASWILSRP